MELYLQPELATCLLSHRLMSEQGKQGPQLSAGQWVFIGQKFKTRLFLPSNQNWPSGRVSLVFRRQVAAQSRIDVADAIADCRMESGPSDRFEVAKRIEKPRSGWDCHV